MAEQTRKRKLGATISVSLKRAKLIHRHNPLAKQKARRSVKHTSSPSTALTVDDLPWKAVALDGEGRGFGSEAGGILGLEEVEGVEVVYKDEERRKIVGFRRINDQRPIQNASSKAEDRPEASVSPASIVIDSCTSLGPLWASYPFHPALRHSLHKRGFDKPTEIQKRSFDIFFQCGKSPEAYNENADGVLVDSRSDIKARDIVGIAQTGSGKTLAYGLPILHHILASLSSRGPTASAVSIKLPAAAQRRPLLALILAPTRELALQVSEHLNACLDHLFEAQSRTDGKEVGADLRGKVDEHKHNPPPPLSVAAIVGGMSAQKQRRILSRGVDVLVATPGRFWDLCGEDHSLTLQLRSLHFLVLDEADRMIEAGHFQELESILRMTARPLSDINIGEAMSADADLPIELLSSDTEISKERNDLLRTFIYSATMSKHLQRDLRRKGGRRSHTTRQDNAASTLDDLLMKLDFRDPDPVIIDLSPKGGCVESLQESKVECLANDKDVYLYYFLLRYPGRSLVFLSSIDGVRRLMPLLELLRFNAWPLHSGLQQKQRLKNLDRFKSMANSVLLATDVAARGLDIPAVDHVIHYQVPRSADAYVHRNGRTARATRTGFGLTFCAPDERRIFRDVLAGLGRSEDVPELNVEHDVLDKLKGRIQLARKIDTTTHRIKKDSHDKNWMRETAEAMEIQLGSDFESDGSDGTSKALSIRSKELQVVNLKAQLKQQLSQPLVAQGVSTRYLTSGSRAIVDDLIEGASHETMLGLQKVQAGSEAVRKPSTGHKKRNC